MSKVSMIFELKSLSQLSQIEICKSLWTHYAIKKSIKSKLQHYDTDITQPEILNQVFQNVDKLPCDRFSKASLKKQAEKMGHVLANWWYQIYSRGYLPEAGSVSLRGRDTYERSSNDVSHFLDYIQWTDIGDIDTAETVRSMYFSGILPDCRDTWMWLTTYCLEDCIEDYVEKSAYYKTQPKPSAFLQLYWIRRTEDRLEDFVPDLTLHSRDNGILAHYPQSVHGVMSLLPILIIYENPQTMKYFWQYLTDDQRFLLIIKFLRSEIVLPNQPFDVQTVRFVYHEALKYHEKFNCLDLMAHDIVLKNMGYWPYDDFLMRSLEKFWSQFEQRHLKSIVKYHRNVDVKQRRLIFWEAWRRLTATNKNRMVSLVCWWNEFPYAKDITIVNFLVNDPALRAKRMALIRQIANRYRMLMCRNHKIETVIDEFCETILKTDAEREAFRSEIVGGFRGFGGFRGLGRRR